MFLYAYKIKNKFQLGEEGIRNIFLWDLKSHYSSIFHKISYFTWDTRRDEEFS